MVNKLYQVWIDGCLWVVENRFFNFLLKVNLAVGSIHTTMAASILHVDLEAVIGVATGLFCKILVR